MICEIHLFKGDSYNLHLNKTVAEFYHYLVEKVDILINVSISTHIALG